MNNSGISFKFDHITEAEAQAQAMFAEGAKLKEIQAATGLNHSQAERAIMKATISADLIAQVKAGGDELPAQVYFARSELKLAWGRIAIILEVPESKARRAFDEATGGKTISQGLRIGKGGRFYMNEPELYAEELSVTGTELSADQRGKRAEAVTTARTLRLLKLEGEELRALANDLGVAYKKGWTKAQFVRAIAAAQNA